MTLNSQPPDGVVVPRRWLTRPAAIFLGGALVLFVAGNLGNAVGSRAAGRSPDTSLANPRVVVLKSQRVLHLFDSDTLVRSYPIDLGTAAIGLKARQGDGRTPLGAFRVVTKNAASPYHRFLGIDYPDAAAVELGLALGLVSAGEAAGIRDALAAGRCPDWGTALGGGIGIHGGRIGRDWTAGCIALSDEHVAELFAVLRIGDVVEILP